MKHIILKDIKLFVKDKRGLALFLLLPIFLISIFAFAYSNMGTKMDPIPLVIIDKNDDKESAKLVRILDSIESINLIHMDPLEAKDKLKSGKVSIGLIIKNNFSDSILNNNIAFEIVYDPSEPLKFGIIKQMILPRLYKFSNYSKSIGKWNNNEIASDISLNIEKEVERSNIITYGPIHKVNKSENIGLIQAIAGTLVLMLLFGVRLIGVQILQEKNDETFLRTMVAPISPNKYLLSKMIFAMIIAFTQMAIMLLFAYFIFDFNLFYDIISLLLLCFMTALACSSFSLLLGIYVNSNEELQSISTILILSMSAIGGSMVPHFIMPSIMQNFSFFSINYWTIQGFFDIYTRQLGLSGIIQNLVVLGGISALFISISWYIFVYNSPFKKLRV